MIFDDPGKLDYIDKIASTHETALPCLSKGWYQRRGRLCGKNISRKAHSSITEKLIVSNEIIAVQKPSTGKSIKDSLQHLSDQLHMEVNKKKCAELHGLIKVAELLLNSGPIVSTQEAGEVLNKERNSSLTRQNEIDKAIVKSLF